MKLKISLLRNSLLFYIIFLLPIASFAQDGTLDTAFGTGGKILTSIGTASSTAYAIAMQNDGKIVVAGVTYNSGSDDNFGLVRYNTNGSLDTTFGTNGKVTTNFTTGSYDVPNNVAIQSDGKIVVVGSTYINSSNTYLFAIARYNTNGSLDTTFDTDGKVTTAMGFGIADVARDVVIQSNGKIVVAGWNNYIVDRNFAVVRYNSNGSLDTSFDSDGKVLTTIGTDNAASSVALQSDGKIVVCGNAGINGTVDFVTVRYNTDGSLDATFDADGIVTTPIGASYDDAQGGVVIQPDGKIVVAGSSNNGDYNVVAVVRYNADGSLDTSFDMDGKVTTDVGPYTDQAYAMVLQSDGKIVTAGVSGNGSTNYFLLIRYNVNGSLDSTFGTNGSVVIGMNTVNYCHANDVVLQNDGKIVTVGFTSNGSIGSFGTMRFNNTILGTETFADTNKEIVFYPNPFSRQTTLQSESNLENATLTFYNTIGQQVYTIENINGQTITISRESIPSGLYFITVTQDNKSIATNKILITD